MIEYRTHNVQVVKFGPHAFGASASHLEQVADIRCSFVSAGNGRPDNALRCH